MIQIRPKNEHLPGGHLVFVLFLAEKQTAPRHEEDVEQSDVFSARMRVARLVRVLSAHREMGEGRRGELKEGQRGSPCSGKRSLLLYTLPSYHERLGEAQVCAFFWMPDVIGLIKRFWFFCENSILHVLQWKPSKTSGYTPCFAEGCFRYHGAASGM